MPPDGIRRRPLSSPSAGSTHDDPYTILGVPRGSSDRAIAAAHRALARRFHPDIAGEGATTRMMRINAAFDAIRNAERRIAFDQLDGWSATPGRRDGETAPDVAARGAPGSTPASAHHGPERDRLRWRPERDGTGGAGPPPGRPSGSVLGFGRHRGWSIGEVARVDPGYLEWLADRREGLPYLDEIDATLRRVGFRTDRPRMGQERPRMRGLFRRD